MLMVCVMLRDGRPWGDRNEVFLFVWDSNINPAVWGMCAFVCLISSVSYSCDVLFKLNLIRVTEVFLVLSF